MNLVSTSWCHVPIGTLDMFEIVPESRWGQLLARSLGTETCSTCGCAKVVSSNIFIPDKATERLRCDMKDGLLDSMHVGNNAS